MGKPTGFLEYNREVWESKPVEERLKDYKEFHLPFKKEQLTEQGARCMDCGIPFCHSHGCPLGNLIPDWNDMVYKNRMEEAIKLLHYTNNFPEFTGRVCPAPCEKACTLSLNDAPVSIELIEHEIIEHAFRQGWVKPLPPQQETGKTAAVIGSGPAGLAAAQQLRRAGHKVTVFERDKEPGGLLRYGIPDFKLEKSVIDRRLEQMKAEGVIFETEVEVGEDISANYLRKHFDAILLACGSRTPRDLPIPGRELDGVHFAMEFLGQNNRRLSGELDPSERSLSAQDKTVVVIGGGDTGSDCVGTSNRQGAKKVYQFELLPKPTDHPGTDNPSWPDWPAILRTSSSHEEGCERRWSISTLEFSGEGRVEKMICEELKWTFPADGSRPAMEPVPGSRFEIQTDLVLLAMGFVHVEHGRLINELEVKLDQRGNVVTDSYGRTSNEGVFAAGDTSLGASLVVRAMATGRKAAIAIDNYLRDGDSVLPDTTLL